MDWKKKMSKLLKKYNYINDLYLKKKKKSDFIQQWNDKSKFTNMHLYN